MQLVTSNWAAPCVVWTMSFLFFVFPNAASSSVSATAPKIDLRCRLSIAATVRSADHVPLKFDLSNHANSAVHVLTWNTPMEGFFGRYLRVTGSEGELQYGGAMMKRVRRAFVHHKLTSFSRSTALF